jgi:hypothetical protein
MDCLVLWGARAGVGPGYTVEVAAVRLSEDIAELRDEGGIPQHVRTIIGILPRQRVLEIRVEGLSVKADPDRTTIREVTNALFELASYHNIVALDPATPLSPNASCSWVPTADPSVLRWARPWATWNPLR